MFVKLAGLLVYLVNDIHIAARRVVAEVHVDMVAINALSTLDIAVVIVHRHTPSLTRRVLAAPGTALRVLNGDVVAVNLNMSFLVVASLFLLLARLGVHALPFGLLSCRLCRRLLLSRASVLVQLALLGHALHLLPVLLLRLQLLLLL